MVFSIRQYYPTTSVATVWLVLIALSVLQAACGGGGGGGNNNGGGGGTDPNPPETVYTGQALLGPIVDADVAIYAIDALSTPHCTVRTTAASNTLTQAGLINIPQSCIADDTLYIIVVSGGEDIDADNNGMIDDTPTPMLGTLHAIASKKQLTDTQWQVNALTEIAYQENKFALILGADANTISKNLNRSSTRLLRQDINGDGLLNSDDLLAWTPRQHLEYASYPQTILQSLNTQLYRGEDLTNFSKMLSANAHNTFKSSLQNTQLTINGNSIIIAPDIAQGSHFGQQNLPLEILDISDAQQTRLVSRISLPDTLFGDNSNAVVASPAVLRHGNLVYITASARKIGGTSVGAATSRSLVADISNPQSPVLGDFGVEITEFVSKLHRHQNTLITLNSDYRTQQNGQVFSPSSMQFFDISTPESPQYTSRVDLDGSENIASFTTSDNIAYLLEKTAILRWNISERSAIEVLSSIPLPANYSATDLVVGDDDIYVSISNETTTRIISYDKNTLTINSQFDVAVPYLKDLHIKNNVLRGLWLDQGGNTAGSNAINSVSVYSLDISNNAQLQLIDISSQPYPGKQVISSVFNGERLLAYNVVLQRYRSDEIAIKPALFDSITRLQLADNIQSIALDGSRVHAALGRSGYQTADFSLSQNPDILTTVSSFGGAPGDIKALAVDNDKLVLGHAAGGLSLLNIADVRNPRLQQTLALNHEIRALFLQGTRAYVANAHNGFLIADFNESSPAVITGQVSFDEVGEASQLVVDGETSYVLGKAHGISALSTRDANTPVRLSQLNFGQDQPIDIAVEGSNAYLTLGQQTLSGSETRLSVLDISNPSFISTVTELATPDSAYRIAQHNQLLFLSNLKRNSVDIINIADPARPVNIATLAIPGKVSDIKANASGLYIAADRTLLRFPLPTPTELP